MAAPTLSIVIPAYNEGRRIRPTLAAIAAYAEQSGGACELVVVDDGSTDDTAAVVRTFAAADSRLAVRLLANPMNRGKGYSVRRGMLDARGDLLLMCDADLSTPIEEVDRLTGIIREGADVVIGSRDQPDSVLSPPQPRWRRAGASVLRAIRRLVLLPRLRDTQCGFKLFRRDAGRRLFSLSREEGFAFDIEVLAHAERLGYRTLEAGVVWRNNPDSRVRVLRDGPRMLAAIFRIARLKMPK